MQTNTRKPSKFQGAASEAGDYIWNAKGECENPTRLVLFESENELIVIRFAQFALDNLFYFSTEILWNRNMFEGSNYSVNNGNDGWKSLFLCLSKACMQIDEFNKHLSEDAKAAVNTFDNDIFSGRHQIWQTIQKYRQDKAVLDRRNTGEETKTSTIPDLLPGTKLVKYKIKSEFDFNEVFVIGVSGDSINVSPVWPFHEGLHHHFLIPLKQYCKIGPWDRKTPWGMSGESLVRSSGYGSSALAEIICDHCDRPIPFVVGKYEGFRDNNTKETVCFSCRKAHYEKKNKGPFAHLYQEIPLIAPAPELKPKPDKRAVKEKPIIYKVDGLDQIALFPKEEQRAIVNRDAELYGYVAKDKSDRQRFKRKLQRTKDWINELPSDEKKALLRMVSELTTPPQKLENEGPKAYASQEMV